MEHVMHHPAAAVVGLAAAELILAIQKAFPQVRLVPCEPVEGEDIHLWAYLPMHAKDQLNIQEQMVELEQTIQEKYSVQTVVVTIPEPE